MENIADIYVASPMQRGLIFHSLYAPESSAYFVQTIYDLEGDLNVTAFRQAWQQVLDRYSILRTSFVWEEMDDVLQLVHKQLTLPWREEDWRSMPETEQQRRLKGLLKEDRVRKLDLSVAPTMRMILIRLHDRQWKLIWTHHHSLLDGWSTFIILKDAFQFYEALSSGRKLHLRPARPYRDYIAWLEKQDISAAERFWRQQLKGLIESTPLIAERHGSRHLLAQSKEEELEEHRERFYLSAESTKAVKEFARRHQLTLNTVAEGAWALLLSRYSSREDVVFGTVVSGRPVDLAGVEELVGPFINLLPLRVRVNGEERLGEWLKALQVKQVELRRYEYSPLVEVQGWSEVPRGVPLFESIMSFHNYPMDTSFQKRGAELRITQVSSIEKTNYPLSLTVIPDAELNLQLSYDRDYFEAEQAQQMLRHLGKLLEEMAAKPGARLRELSLLTEQEWRTLLFEWNDTQSDYPAQQLVSQLFEAQVKSTPDAPAVASDDASLTYQELNEKANQIAHYLLQLGVGPEKIVGVLMERSVEMVTALLGILKAGGAYLPIDPAYPRQRQVWMLKDAEADVLLMKDWPAEGFPDYKGHLISLDIFEESIARESTQNPTSRAQADNLAYVIYTSGSTGQPKGVAVTHRGLLNLCHWHLSNYQVTPSDRATQLAGVGFDASVWELWPYLASGASVHLPHEEIHLSPADLRDWLIKRSITITFLPTPLAENVLSLDWPGNLSLRSMLTGGDRLHHYPARPLPFGLFNNYGPTENTVVATSGPVRAEQPGDKAPSIGRPIANTKVYLLDAGLQPVPIGVIGELYIGGDSLARGYLYRQELTAEKFSPDPFSPREGSRLYRTGDLGRYRPGGEIDFVGRSDDQVKVRGCRIELGEIEATLRQHQEIKEAVVVLNKEAAEHKQLVAYVVPKQKPAPSASNLKDYLRQRLPDYMIPSAFVGIDALPVTPNGKVDRRSLPSPDTQRPEVESRYAEPRTEVERLLREIWQQVLGVERVGIYDNFFDLGGDSILSIQIIARANRVQLQLMPKHLFENPTVAGLAALAGNAPLAARGSELVTGEMPLTPIARMFFGWDIVERNHYNQAVMLKVKPSTDLLLLEQATEHLLLHHDALRLRFHRTEEGWQAVCGPAEKLSFSRVAVRHLAKEARKEVIEREALETQSKSLDIEKGPLMRAVYFDCGSEESGRLLLVIHHLAVDGVSWRILLDDLQRGYEQLSAGEESIELGPKTTSFKEWATLQLEEAQSAQRQREVSYWTEQAWGEARPLPLDREAVELKLSGARTLRRSLSVEETSALLQEVPEAYHTQIMEVLLAALGRALGQWIGEGAVVVDAEGHGREEIVEGVDLSRTVGWFTAIFPVLLRTSASEETGEGLKRVKEQLRGIPQKGIGYGMLRYLSEDESVRRRMRRIPKAQVNFNYLGQFDQVADSDAIITGTAESAGAAQSLDNPIPTLITVNSTVHGGQLEMAWTYSEVVHDAQTIEWLAEQYLEELRQIIDHCQSPDAGGFTASDFPLASLNEEQLGRLSRVLDRIAED